MVEITINVRCPMSESQIRFRDVQGVSAKIIMS